jgi:hypothetical protein
MRHLVIRRPDDGSNYLLPEWMTFAQAGTVRIVPCPRLSSSTSLPSSPRLHAYPHHTPQPAGLHHTVAELTYDLWQQAVDETGARSRFFERMRSITVFLVFRPWTDLLTTLAFASQLPQPP